MALFSNIPTNRGTKEKEHSGILGAFSVDVIKYEPETNLESRIIAHKFEYEDFPSGSYLIVGPSQMAIFTNNLSAGNSLTADGSGQAQVSVFPGPCKIKLETGDSRFAPFRNISHALTGGDSAFHSTVYFLNTTYMNDLSWGTQSPIVVVDPEEEINVHVRAFGLFGAHIEHVDSTIAAVQARKFLQKVVGTQADFTQNELVNFMRAKILEKVPNLLANSIIHRGISVLKISAYLSDFSETIYHDLIDHFDTFGLTLDNFSFHNINVPDDDLRELNQAKIMRKKSQLEAEGAAARMDIESAARARMRQREGYTYQQEQGFNVMQAAAENEGTSGSVMGAGMGLGLGFGVGGAFGSEMNHIARDTMSGMRVATTEDTQKQCPSCKEMNPAKAKFCLSCGAKMAVEEGVCPDCGERIIPGAKFCLNCGKRLTPRDVCPDCGAKLVPGAKFCLECGKKV